MKLSCLFVQSVVYCLTSCGGVEQERVVSFEIPVRLCCAILLHSGTVKRKRFSGKFSLFCGVDTLLLLSHEFPNHNKFVYF